MYEDSCSASTDANRLPPVSSMTALAIAEWFSFLEVTSNLSHYANQHVLGTAEYPHWEVKQSQVHFYHWCRAAACQKKNFLVHLHVGYFCLLPSMKLFWRQGRQHWGVAGAGGGFFLIPLQRGTVEGLSSVINLLSVCFRGHRCNSFLGPENLPNS